jgi:galactokinase
MLKEIDDAVVHGRCFFVLEENQRVIDGSRDLRSGALEAFGEKMYRSHQGLSKQYQVSCPELDLLVDYTRDQAAVLGARMMGGGFGGCTINLIRKDVVNALISEFAKQYRNDTGREMEVYPVKIADGTSLVAKRYKQP